MIQMQANKTLSVYFQSPSHDFFHAMPRVPPLLLVNSKKLRIANNNGHESSQYTSRISSNNFKKETREQCPCRKAWAHHAKA